VHKRSPLSSRYSKCQGETVRKKKMRQGKTSFGFGGTDFQESEKRKVTIRRGT